MTRSFLSRRVLGRVVTSLLKSEMKAAKPDAYPEMRELAAADIWPEDLRIGGSGPSALPCDSLDLLRLTAAVNEMFHLHEARQERDLLAAGTFGDWLDGIQNAWASGVTQITFRTSGSTGKPKSCVHDFSHLKTETTYLAELFASRTRVIALTPAHHIYGFLFTAMLPDRLGHVLDDVHAKPHSAYVPQSGDLVVAFPERWQWLARTVSDWPNGVAGVVSTAPCPSDLTKDLMENGLQSFTEVYGSSETAGVGTRQWPQTGYRLMPHWQIGSSNDPEGTLLIHSSGLEVRVKDHLELLADGSFTLAGRIDAAVQVGGVNVYPERIAASMQEQPGVRDVIVRLSTPERGGRLKAFVVPQEGIDQAELRSRLTEWSMGVLNSPERLQSITFGESLPKDDKGKNRDW